MKKKFLIFLLMIFCSAGGSVKAFGAEEKAYNGNAVTGFYGVYESSTSESSSETTSSETTETTETTETSTKEQQTVTNNGTFPNTGTETISPAYQKQLPLTGDTTYHLQMLGGMVIIGLAMYLIKNKQKNRQ